MTNFITESDLPVETGGINLARFTSRYDRCFVACALRAWT
jgi:hypothetical protein